MATANHKCDRCRNRHESVELRKSYEMLCDSCENGYVEGKPERHLNENEGNILLEIVEEEEGMVVVEDKEVDEEQVQALSITSKHNKDVIIKNNPHEEMCLKCEKKLVNGVRCTRCRRAWHWKCAGILKDQIKNAILQSNSWECHLCRTSDKDCHSYKAKVKEIKA